MKRKFEILHWTCSVCNKALTYEEDDEVKHESIFEVIRAKRELEVDSEGYLEESNLNQKMQRQLCESCFNKVLNESQTLGRLFWNNGSNNFIY